MKFVALDTDPAIYRSDRYDLVHRVVGFGIVLVEVWERRDDQRPAKLASFTGHNALKHGMDYCHERERHARRDAA